MIERPEPNADELGSAVQELTAVVERLSDEVATLRGAVDDLREELAYELRKLRDEVAQPSPPYRLTSMPRDPLAEDFGERVNAVNVGAISEPPKTLEGLLEGLMAEPVAQHLAAEDWVEDQEFAPGAVVEIEPSIFDWFAEYPVAVHQGTNWCVVDDGLGNFFALWHRAERCFVRLLTGDEQQAFTRLTGIAPEVEPDDQDEEAPPPTADVEPDAPIPAQQQTLW